MCGLDVCDSLPIWSKYRSFEVDELEDLLDDTTTATITAAKIQKAKESVLAVYKRQLALPLIGSNEVLIELNNVLSEHYSESDENIIQPQQLAEKIKNSKLLLQPRLVFEEFIASTNYLKKSTIDSLKCWKSYIELELSEKNYFRVQRLYERCLIDCSSSVEMWSAFVDFALSVVKNYELLASVCRRVCRVDRRSATQWRLYVLAMEYNTMTFTTIHTELQIALLGGFDSADDYVDLLLAVCRVGCRYVNSAHTTIATATAISTAATSTATATVTPTATTTDRTIDSVLELCTLATTVRELFVYVENFLICYYPQWYERLVVLYHLWADYERYPIHQSYELVQRLALLLPELALQLKDTGLLTQLLGNNSRKNSFGTFIWQNATTRYSSSYSVWVAAVAWGVATKNYDFCRQKYRKVMNVATDYPIAAICRDWLAFEEQYGSSLELADAWRKVLSVLPKDNSGSSGAGCGSNSTVGSESTVLKKRDRTELANSADTTEQPAEKVRKTLPTTATTTAAPPAMDVSSNEELFVTVENIPFATTTEELQHTFNSCGKVALAELVLLKSGRPSGVAIVKFTDEAAVAKAVAMTGTLLGSRKLIVNSGLPPKATATAAAKATSKKKEVVGSKEAPQLTTIFVRNVATTVSTEELERHFASCGQILQSKIPIDKKTGDRKVRNCHCNISCQKLVV